MANVIVAVDAMGGDHGPQTVVSGAVDALEDNAIDKIILVGREGDIRQVLGALNYDENRVEVVHAQEVIGMEEIPTTALKTKKDSSIVVGLNLVKSGHAAAFVSAGSTGAVLAGGTTIVGRIKGIARPALGVVFPSTRGYTFLVDAGANVDAKPEYLLQFAQMGACYMEAVMGIETPKVGLINVGAEREKGNALTKEAYGLLAASDLNFTGNVEGREIPLGAVDVAVCDAFVGNIILKYSEGFAKGIMSMLKEELMSSGISKLGALLSKGAYGRLRKRFDYTEVGGAPFVGLNGLVVKAHGSSNAVAIKNAVKQCSKFIKADVVGKIREKISHEGVEENGI
ncbi:MAG: phosphate acyltransferase PlsX [Clostridiales bacterium]|jgi:glycerol-3-phosphate acyltransferase PlsX|nr:phosphate acyltransferase PlsX [Clostridiales bacterium]